jgi:hypothetical protein
MKEQWLVAKTPTYSIPKAYKYSTIEKREDPMRKIINFIAFQTAWFAAVLGAANGMPWLGLIAVPAFVVMTLAISQQRQMLFLALAAACLGFFADTILMTFGVFSPVPFPYPPPFSPLWMVMLWVNLAMTLNDSMAWLRGRFVLAVIFGAIGGPLAYYSGAKLGAADVPAMADLVVIGIAWAIAFPALSWINEFLQKPTHAVIPEDK